MPPSIIAAAPVRPEPRLSDRLVWAAVQAPSAENRLAYQAGWSDPVTLELRPTGAYHGLSGQLRFLADIGAGAMAENVRCQAGEAGFALVQDWDRDPDARVRARLRLAPDGVPDGLARAIAERCTNRRPYDPTPLDPALAQALAAAASGIPGTEAVVLDQAAKDGFAAAAALAEGARLRSRVLHHEMYAGIRFDAGWSSSAIEGIPPGSLEVEAFARPGFLALRSWPLCRLVAPLGGAAGFGWRSGRHLVERSGAVVVIASGLPPDQAAPSVGQAMQRIWLQATALGLAVQPMPAAALFALPWWQGVPAGVGPRLAGWWSRTLPGRIPCMALRIGRAPPPTVRAGRPVSPG